jgi:glycosyltransferase involved in cell wall biosynthesis
MTVGVVLPVLNGADYIEAAIDSVLSQHGVSIDLVVVDDGSTDDTPHLVRSYDDPRVTLLRNDRTRGVAASRNRGVEHVAGDPVAFIDHDDIWHPRKLQRHLEAHRESRAALVYSDIRRVDADGTPRDIERKPDPRPVGEPLVRQLFFGGGAVITTMSSVTIRRAAWAGVGGEDSGYDIAGDIDLYVRLAGEHPFCRVPEALVDRRRHGRNISSDYRQLYIDSCRLVSRATARYVFLDRADVQRKRATMAYRRATSALAANDARDAVRFALESLQYEPCVRPVLVFLLGTLDIATGSFSPGTWLYNLYDRRADT